MSFILGAQPWLDKLNFPRVANQHPSPAYQLSCAGENITARLQDRLISLTLTDNRGFEADQLDIELDDSDSLLAMPKRNVQISVSLGWKGSGLIDKGKFTVDEIEHSGSPDRMIIRARSADMAAGLTTQRERSFHGKTVGDILRTIALQNQLTAIITPILDKQVLEHLDQTNESDANLLSRLADLFDAVATVKQNKLLFIKKGLAASAGGHPLEQIVITRKNGDNHRFSIADRNSYRGVKAFYSDKRTAKKGEIIVGKDTELTFSKESTEEKNNRNKKSRSKAASNTGRATTARVHKTLAPEGKISASETNQSHSSNTAQTNNIKVLRHIYANRTNAQRAAQAEWQRLQRGIASFSITLAVGRPEIATESPVILRGWKPEIDQADWIVTRVVHTLSSQGYTTALELEVKAGEIAD